MDASGKLNITPNDAGPDLSSCVQERMGLSSSPSGAKPCINSTSMAVQAGSVELEAMEAEDTEPATSSRAHQTFRHER